MTRRSPHAQIEAMRKVWPSFTLEQNARGLQWTGYLQPKSQIYTVKILWDEKWFDRPYVMLIEPRLRPRLPEEWRSIPHLLFSDSAPEASGLCLFDPEGLEWTPADLIAETTIKWTSEWLLYYELWHLIGHWLAPGIGHETTREAQQMLVGG